MLLLADSHNIPCLQGNVLRTPYTEILHTAWPLTRQTDAVVVQTEMRHWVLHYVINPSSQDLIFDSGPHVVERGSLRECAL